MAIIKVGNEIKLGADPEFFLLPEEGNDLVTIDEDWTGEAGNYSHDGSSSELGEIRPSPGSPREVTENIRAVIRKISEAYPGKRLVLGGGRRFSMSAGGHIHFNLCESRDDREPPAGLVNALDFYLGRNLKGMEGGERESSTSYGAAGAYRTKDHGFEYRTPPSFITDPTLTEAIFAIAYRLGELSLNGIIQLPAHPRALTNDYDALIPVGTPFESYYRLQVENFKDFVFGGFDLATDDAFNRWLSPIPYAFKAGQGMYNILADKKAAALAAQRLRENEILRKSRDVIGERTKATPILCAVTVEDMRRSSRGRNSSLATYSVIPDVLIHLGNVMTSNIAVRKHTARPTWFARRVDMDSETVYISHDLKGKFKIPRDIGFPVKYVDLTRNNQKINAIISGRSNMEVNDIINGILKSTRRKARNMSALVYGTSRIGQMAD